MKNLFTPDTPTMYNALLSKDSSFEGIFFAGIKTTGIFCRPTCTAKKPKKENVEFFFTVKDALLHGYRPCKICNPTKLNGAVPDWMNDLLKEIEEGLIVKLNDTELRKRNIDPARARRWFKKHYGMTFQSYLRLLRINSAYNRIKNGEKVIDTAYDSGYESLSAFADSFKKTMGHPPSKSRNKKIVSVTRILTPLGPMLAGANDDGICLLEFVDRRMIETQINRMKKLLNAEFIPGANKHFDELKKQLKEYFDGKRKEFDLPLILDGTEFQQKVWKELQKIPYGKTRSYDEQAKALKIPKAIRAVARANGDNRIAIIVPCHRVIGKDGKLVGYGGGIWRKQFLLNLEKRNAEVIN